MAALNDWQIVDANNNAAPPDGWPENTMAYSEVNDTGRAVQGTLKRFFSDTNGSLNAAGVADAYTLTLNETGYTAYFDGMWFACSIPASNTGACTIDVNGIGAQAIKARDGSDLTAGTLDSGGIYEFRYDGVNFQLMGTLGNEVGVGQATLTNSNAVDLVDTDVALRTGAVDPDSAQHLEMTLSELQSKSDATTAAGLDINPLGGTVRVGGLIGSDFVQLYGNGQRALVTAIGGIEVWGGSSNDPTAGGVQDTAVNLTNDAGAPIGDLGFNGNATLDIENFVHGGGMRLRTESSGGIKQNNIIMQADTGASELLAPGGDGWAIYHDTSQIAVQTFVTGIRVRGASGNDVLIDALTASAGQSAIVRMRNTTQQWDLFLDGTDDRLKFQDVTQSRNYMEFGTDATDFIITNIEGDRQLECRNGELRLYGGAVVPNPALTFWNSSFTRIGFVNATVNDMVIASEVNGGGCVIRGTDTGAVTRDLIRGDPDGVVNLYDQGVAVARTAPAADGGFEINNTKTGGGFERALTVSDVGGAPLALSAIVRNNQNYTNNAAYNNISELAVVLRSGASNDRFAGRWVTFTTTVAAGTNPGLRQRPFLSGASLAEARGLISVTAGGGVNQVVPCAPQTGATGINAGSDRHNRYDYAFRSTSGGQTLNHQAGQSTSSATTTTILTGSSLRLYDYDAG